MPGQYLYKEGRGSNLVLLVASVQEWDDQVEDAAQLWAVVVHHGPGRGEGGGPLRLSSPRGTRRVGV